MELHNAHVEAYIDWEGDEPCGVGHWMIDYERKARIEHRIACPELGYPASEALYADVHQWEEVHGEDWLEFLNF